MDLSLESDLLPTKEDSEPKTWTDPGHFCAEAGRELFSISPSLSDRNMNVCLNWTHILSDPRLPIQELAANRRPLKRARKLMRASPAFPGYPKLPSVA